MRPIVESFHKLIDSWDNTSLIASYTSNSQRARVLSEAWVLRNGYCLACKSDSLLQTAANTRTKDFICPQCSHGYELKSTRRRIREPNRGWGILRDDGNDSRRPHAQLSYCLEYSPTWEVRDLTALHHSLITQDCIEERKALGPMARRAGWIGCNIILPKIALEGRISIGDRGQSRKRGRLRERHLRAFSFFRECLRSEEAGLRLC